MVGFQIRLMYSSKISKNGWAMHMFSSGCCVLSDKPGAEISIDAIKLNIDNLSKMIAKAEDKTEAEAKKQAKISKRRYRCQTASISFLGMVLA